MQLISENQESFLNMINEPNESDSTSETSNEVPIPDPMGGGDSLITVPNPNLEMTEQDREAIERVNNI